MKRERSLKPSVDESKLMRRVPERPLVWLGEKERAVDLRLGERFPATAMKEGDFVFDLPRPRRLEALPSSD